ncbi:hypothetical protein GQ600_18862 [Phytophthora cactorum]|nr:hypothetical protein GQ600_18862 [Phytophthora cactorum]
MQPFRTLPPDEDGGREVFDGPVKQKQQSNIPSVPPQKIYPVNNDAKDQTQRRARPNLSAHTKMQPPGNENKLLMKFGDLALETLLLYQMLEAGSPTPLIAIFTVVVATNALACAAMMFVPHERAPLAETLIDVLFDFLIIVGCPMLVIFYCLSSFTFDRAKFAINLEVFPAGWFEQGAGVIADAEQTAVIYESLKSLRILTPLNFFTRIGVNMTLCFRLWQLVDLLRDTKTQNSSVYPKRHLFGAAFLIVFAIMLIVFVEESMRTSSLACQPHPECVVNARRWTIVESGSLTQCPCIMLIDRDIAPKTYAKWENPRM